MNYLPLLGNKSRFVINMYELYMNYCFRLMIFVNRTDFVIIMKDVNQRVHTSPTISNFECKHISVHGKQHQVHGVILYSYFKIESVGHNVINIVPSSIEYFISTFQVSLVSIGLGDVQTPKCPLSHSSQKFRHGLRIRSEHKIQTDPEFWCYQPTIHIILI